jgi:hypothetical protein
LETEAKVKENYLFFDSRGKLWTNSNYIFSFLFFFLLKTAEEVE